MQTYETEAVAFLRYACFVSGGRLSDNYQSFYMFTAHDTVTEVTP